MQARLMPLCLRLFAQMLPATLVTPAIRPLFAMYHGGNEGAMHAFMAANMLGGAIGAPWLGRADDARGRGRALLVLIVILDAILLAAFALRIPTYPLLVLRTLEGAMHVGAASMLMGDAVARANTDGGRVTGMAALSVVSAIACGSFLGGLLVSFDARLPFAAASFLALAVAATLGERASAAHGSRPRAATIRLILAREPDLWMALGAAFVARFAIGCIVVTFALFAHRAHGYSDRTIGILFSLVTIPFALFAYPAGRMLDRVPRAAVLAGGALACAAVLVALGWVPRNGIGASLLLFGIGSSMIFVPVLSYATTFGLAEERATVMASIHGAGCLGMLLGPTAAGIVSASVQRATDPVTAYRAVFVVGGAAILVWLLVSAGVLIKRTRDEAAALQRHVATEPPIQG
ncbi:MFS transporter [Pendulispora albinea]|uniref:MFS transporter n=1 Tax=Pendulispora albinea TaxID=2741071 RepID=A0ABZ2MC59_9BACT